MSLFDFIICFIEGVFLSFLLSATISTASNWKNIMKFRSLYKELPKYKIRKQEGIFYCEDLGMYYSEEAHVFGLITTVMFLYGGSGAWFFSPLEYYHFRKYKKYFKENVEE